MHTRRTRPRKETKSRYHSGYFLQAKSTLRGGNEKLAINNLGVEKSDHTASETGQSRPDKQRNLSKKVEGPRGLAIKGRSEKPCCRFEGIRKQPCDKPQAKVQGKLHNRACKVIVCNLKSQSLGEELPGGERGHGRGEQEVDDVVARDER